MLIYSTNQRQKLENLEDNFSDSEEPEREDEKPLVVVLKSGDLTAQEAEEEQKRLAKGKYKQTFILRWK